MASEESPSPSGGSGAGAAAAAAAEAVPPDASAEAVAAGAGGGEVAKMEEVLAETEQSEKLRLTAEKLKLQVRW